MHRRPLLDLLLRYRPTESADADARERMIAFIQQHPDCFERSLSVGHITGAAWLLDPAGERVLLTHHRKLNLWLQLGGHADGDPDALAVALREAREESGIDAIVPLSREIFDLDVHEIPAHGDAPAHLHYDVRFLTQAVETDAFRVSDESHALRWFTADELDARTDLDEAVRRLNRKWRAWRANQPAYASA